MRLGHKLLLPWQGTTIIERVLDAWLASRIDRVILVSRPGDVPLHEVVRRRPAVELLIPTETPGDMKRSVWLGLRHLMEHAELRASDRWLIAPADLPTLSPALINRVIESGRDTSEIVVPMHARRRGHPVSFPFSIANRVDELGDHEGINRLLELYPVKGIAVEADQLPQDVDTEDEYRRLRETLGD